jgi:transposase
MQKQKTWCYDPQCHQFTGPGGTLSLDPTDKLAHQFLMLVEGQCQQASISAVAQRYGYTRQRYYQLFRAFQAGGLAALLPKKTGPKTNYRRTEEATRQVLRHCFLDPEASAQVVTQKLRQTHFPISLRSVQRIFADWGLQKKTLCPQSRQEGSGFLAGPEHPPEGAPGRGHGHQPGAAGAPGFGPEGFGHAAGPVAAGA